MYVLAFVCVCVYVIQLVLYSNNSIDSIQTYRRIDGSIQFQCYRTWMNVNGISQSYVFISYKLSRLHTPFIHIHIHTHG